MNFVSKTVLLDLVFLYLEALQVKGVINTPLSAASVSVVAPGRSTPVTALRQPCQPSDGRNSNASTDIDRRNQQSTALLPADNFGSYNIHQDKKYLCFNFIFFVCFASL